ncbi:SH3 domain protein, partial [Ostertagia ostertagi]
CRPTASPSLVGNKDRFGGLLDEYSSRRTSPAPLHPAVSVRTATAIFKFDAKSPRELSLNRGEIVRITREVDANLVGGRTERSKRFVSPKLCAVGRRIRSFAVQGKSRLPVHVPTIHRTLAQDGRTGDVAKGDRRELARRHKSSRSYVRLLEDIPDDVNEIPQLAYSPDRPKTPKVYEKDAYRDFFDLQILPDESSINRSSGRGARGTCAPLTKSLKEVKLSSPSATNLTREIKDDGNDQCKDKRAFKVTAHGDTQPLVIVVDRFGRRVRVQPAI